MVPHELWRIHTTGTLSAEIGALRLVVYKAAERAHYMVLRHPQIVLATGAEANVRSAMCAAEALALTMAQSSLPAVERRSDGPPSR